MCGVAGLNVSEKTALKIYGKDGERVREIIQEGWLHNLHRGVDAAGYFAVHAEKHSTRYFKCPGSALKILDAHVNKKDFELDPYTVMGMHTRAATTGDASDHSNNHPVIHNGVYVTHNGRITNHFQLRKKLLEKDERKDAPEVDSWLIPVALDYYAKNAFDTEGIERALEALVGSWVFHAVWLNAPGISLIARGTGRPCVVAYHPKNGVFYGSEIESVWSLIDAANLHPNGQKWEWVKLDANAYIIVDNGEIVKWGKTTSNQQQSNWTFKRYLPSKKAGERGKLVYEHSKKNDWPQKTTQYAVKQDLDSAELVYQREAGLAPGQTYKGPPTNNSTILHSIFEADAVYKIDGNLHAIYDNVEIIMSPAGALIDVFNHSLGSVKSRIDFVENDGSQGSGNLKRDVFTTVMQKDRVTSYPEYQYMIDMRALQAKNDDEDKERKKRLSDFKSKSLGRSKDGTLTYLNQDNVLETLDGTKGEVDAEGIVPVFRPSITIDWNNLFEEMHFHRIAPIMFLHNATCAAHKQLFTEHQNPFDCDVLLVAASMSMSAVSDLSIFQYMDDGIKIKFSKGASCYDKNKEFCVWKPTELLKLKFGNSSWFLRLADECQNCGVSREIVEAPDWILDSLEVVDYLDLRVERIGDAAG